MHLYVAGVEAQDVADHQPDAVALDRLDDAPRRCGVMRERLFEQDRLAGLGGGDGRLFMQAVRQADAHRLEPWQREQRAKVANACRAGGCGEIRDARAGRCRRRATSSAAG